MYVPSRGAHDLFIAEWLSEDTMLPLKVLQASRDTFKFALHGASFQKMFQAVVIFFTTENKQPL